MRLPTFAILALLATAAPAAARVLDLPVRDPRREALEAPCYTAEKLEIRLRSWAAAAARAVTARRPYGVLAVDLPGVDAAAAASGAWLEPEFRGERTPSPGASDFTAFYVVHLGPGVALEQALDRFAAAPEVEAADPIAIMPVDAVVPNDSLWVREWWHHQVSGHDIRTPYAWDYTTGDSGIVVGVIDTGVCPYHPDLAAQIWHNAAEVNGLPGVDDDGNGYVDDTWGWDFVSTISGSGTFGAPGEDVTDEDNDPNDYAGHGTFVAGVLGAAADNGIGLAGAAWKVRIMPLRIGWSATCPGCQLGVVDMSFAAQALRYATRMGADVVNCSFSTANQGGLDAAARAATQAGVVVVAAAGNNNQQHYLATRPDVIAVAATDSNDVVAPYSNRGAYVDLTAPGSDFYSTFVQRGATTDSIGYRQPGYTGPLSGTSFAAPLVSGAVALVQGWRRAIGVRPLSAMGAVLRMSETSDDITDANPGNAGYGAGRLNVVRALTDPPRSSAWRTGASTIGPAVAFEVGGRTHAAWVTSSQKLMIVDAASGDTVALASLPGFPVRQLAGARMGGGVGFALFAGTHNGRMTGFDSTGTPLPGWPVTGPTGITPALGGGPALADLDGDGVKEIVCGGDDGKVWAWHVNGTRVTGFPVLLSGLPISAPVACAELDGAPGAEIVVATREADVHVLRGDGSELDGFPINVGGLPLAPGILWVADSARIAVASGRSVTLIDPAGAATRTFALADSAVQDLALGDLDGDGTDEIVVPNALGQLEAVNVSGVHMPGWPAPLPDYAIGGPVLGHLTGRSRPDALLMTNFGLVAFTDSARVVGTFPKQGGAGQAPTLMELDRDGATEVLAGTGVDSSLFVYDAGRGTWNTTPQPWPTARGDFARTGARPRDAIPPAAITDLMVAGVGPDTVRLAWTAPGDDGMVGRASAYELRMSTLRSEAGSASRGIVVGGVPAPDSAGTPQSALVTGLPPGARCWFWLRTRDDAGNQSASSNVVGATLPLGGPGSGAVALVPERTVGPAPVRLAWHTVAGRPTDITVFDVTGRRLQTFAVGPASRGVLEWNGRDAGGSRVPAGVYFARLACGSIHLQTRVVLLP